jgi:hypothetical protein
MDEAKYYFASGNEQRGPFALAEFLALGLRADTLVWREGMSQWQPYDSLPELQSAPAAPTTTPTEFIATQSPARPMLLPLDATPSTAAQQLAYRTAPFNTRQTSGLAIASMVLGIVAVVTMCGGHFAIFALPCSILALIFGFIAKGKANRGEAGGKGMAIAGIVMGCVHLGIVAIILLAILGFCVAIGLH